MSILSLHVVWLSEIHEISKWQSQNYNLSLKTPEPVYLSFKQILLSIHMKPGNSISLSCIICNMTFIMYLPLFPLLLAILFFVPRPRNVAMNKADKILPITDFAFLRWYSDDKVVKHEIILLWEEHKRRY